ncbi:MAG: hypothetical protein J6U67_07055 [Lachnospiraceae bacterium]|nr:hypothetical protein [Lachnospiraceae bacterium]
MTDDIKIALKMTNFSIQSKWMKALLIIFFVMGILFEFMPGAYSPNNLGGLYLMLTPAYLYQMVVTPTVSSYVAASQRKRDLQTKLPALVVTLGAIISFTLHVVLRWVNYSIYDYSGVESAYNTNCLSVITASFLFFLMAVYSGAAYKKFIVSLVFFMILLFPSMIFFMNPGILNSLGFVQNITFSMAAICGYIVILLGGLAMYLISLALYKKGMDVKAFKAALARAGR